MARPGHGQVAWEWPHLPTGAVQSSIAWADTFTGRARVAVDESGRRLAHTDGEKVTVVGWDPA